MNTDIHISLGPLKSQPGPIAEVMVPSCSSRKTTLSNLIPLMNGCLCDSLIVIARDEDGRDCPDLCVFVGYQDGRLRHGDSKRNPKEGVYQPAAVAARCASV